MIGKLIDRLMAWANGDGAEPDATLRTLAVMFLVGAMACAPVLAVWIACRSVAASG